MKSWMKALAVLVALLAVLFVALLVLPFVIDFNQFKGQIQNSLSQKLNAKIDFESARLSIWGGLGVKLKKVSLENTDAEFAGTRFFYVDELTIKAEFLPLFEKKLVVYADINRPDILVAKRGSSNSLAALPKPAPTTPEGAKEGSNSNPEANKTSSADKTPPAEKSQTLEEFEKNFVLKELDIKNASVTVKDFQSGTDHVPLKISDLNITINNIGLQRDIRILIGTDLSIKNPGLNVTGPLQLAMTTQIYLDGQKFKNCKFQGTLDLDKLNINAQDLFVKNQSIPLNMNFLGSATPDSLNIEKMNVTLHNLELAGVFNISDFNILQTTAHASINTKDLQRLGDVLPKHKSLFTNASLDLQADLKGPLSKPMNVKTQIDLKTFLAGSDLALNWKSNHLKPIQGEAVVTSNRLDLGSLVKPFMQSPKNEVNTHDTAPVVASKEVTDKAAVAPAPQKSTKAEPEFELTADQKKLLENADIGLKITSGQLKYETFNFDNLYIDAGLQGLSLNLRQMSVGVLKGKMKADGMVNLSTAPLPFRCSLSLDKIGVDKLTEFFFADKSSWIEGNISFNANLDGRGTTLQSLTKTLNGGGHFVFEDGELHSASVAAIAQQKFDGFVSGLSIVDAADSVFSNAQKILDNPVVKKNTAGKDFGLQKYKQQYENLKNVKIADKIPADKSLKNVEGTFAVKQGRIYVTSKKSGADGSLALDSSVGLDLSLNGKAVFEASDATKQKMLTQSKYASLLFDENNKLILNMLLGGTAKAPAVTIDFAPLETRFKKNALALADSEVRKHTEEFMKEKVNAVIDQLKNKAGDDVSAKAKAEADKFMKKNKEKLKDIFGR